MNMNKPAMEAAEALGEGVAEGEVAASESGGGNTFFLPKDFLGGKKYKAGETVILTVVGEDEDGDTEVSLGEDEQPDWRDDLKQTMAASGENPMASTNQ